MKLLETLSNEEKISLLNGNVVGIFTNLILEGDSFYNKKYDLCLGYYFNRSGEKRISSMYEKILEIKNNMYLDKKGTYVYVPLYIKEFRFFP